MIKEDTMNASARKLSVALGVLIMSQLRISIVGDFSRDCKDEDYPFLYMRNGDLWM